ncbi:hypothetical protein BGW38_010835 [Lunasporangiospora selenospora]|uniref:Uncharacterized protein n=1 Tax=Lunasporangiospora selenospora TaxID=979761 RepID=A0A9P6KF97_9FUNG|nr:hypothetical protein BGW38_010835 [Lunasporangiospora selenospora]
MGLAFVGIFSGIYKGVWVGAITPFPGIILATRNSTNRPLNWLHLPASALKLHSISIARQISSTFDAKISPELYQMIHTYKFTHRAVTRVTDDDSEANVAIPPEINMSNLAMFSTILFIDEFQQHGLGDAVDIAKTCNMSEWFRRIYAGKGEEEEDDNVDIMTLPAKDITQAGLIYATSSGENASKEAFTSFLFAYHKPSLAKTMTSNSSLGTSNGYSLTSETQALIASKGVTHIWLCGSDPDHRRHRLMTHCLKQLEKDVLAWKESGKGSGVISVHTIPQVFPGMVQFLPKSGFHGGDKVIGGENGKVLYYKVL